MESNTYQEAFSDYEEIDLKELLLDIWNNKCLILIITFVFVLIAAVYSFFIAEPVYQASTTIQLSNIGGIYSNPDFAARLFKSNNIVIPIMNELGQEYTEAELQRYLENNMDTTSYNETGIIDISLKDTDYIVVKEILNRILTNYKDNADSEYNKFINNVQKNLESIELSNTNLEKQIKAIKQNIDNISNSSLESTEKGILIAGLTNELRVYLEQVNSLLKEKRIIKEELLKYYRFRFLTKPYVSEDPVSPMKMLNLAIAAVLGVFISIFIVFIKKLFNEN